MQRGRELLHRPSPIPRFSRDERESLARGPDSGNKADIEPEAEEECLWELNPLVTSINKLDINNPANDVGKWYINEELIWLTFLCLLLIPCRQTLVPM